MKRFILWWMVGYACTARAQTVLDINVQPQYVVRAQAAQDGTQTDELCLVDDAGQIFGACVAPGSNGIATWVIGHPAPAKLRVIGRNAAGSSRPSSNAAYLRQIGDCNGDWAITVQDIVAVNRSIFNIARCP